VRPPSIPLYFLAICDCRVFPATGQSRARVYPGLSPRLSDRTRYGFSRPQPLVTKLGRSIPLTDTVLPHPARRRMTKALLAHPDPRLCARRSKPFLTCLDFATIKKPSKGLVARYGTSFTAGRYAQHPQRRQ